MKTILFIALSVAAVVFRPVLANDAHRRNANSVVVAQAPSMTEGEVRKVDKAAKKITLKHGPIPSLDMPGMTMVFRVADAALLEGVKAGDKVEFRAEKVGEDITVMKLKAVK